MKAWIVRQWCEPEQMRFEDVALPEPGPRQVRVKIAAAALNFLDTLMIQGRYQVKPAFPFTPGVEIAGVVDAAGEGCRLAPGTPVAGTLATGGYAEYAVAEERTLAPLPAALDLKVAATMAVVHPTAHLCLRDAGRLQPGETVMVSAAAGGVGLAALQLAKRWGAGKVIALAGAEKLQLCRDYGADDAIDYGEPGWSDAVRAVAPKGLDVVVDMVGGDVAEQSLRQLAWRGRLIVVGFAGGTIPALQANRLLLKSASAIGVFWGQTSVREPELAQQILAELFEMAARRELRPILSREYPLAQAPQAMRDLAARRTTGKVVLVP
ncbi:MAG TPA: NADPH:quinone oxidoreductase family protein [Burkholderiaceae bacterium]|nr:NADPH:quinone oxidoreductase family protein [Burkholderiaceae bacterium]